MYFILRVRSGWSARRYQNWIEARLIGALFRP
jgi:hypothetical protein